MVIVYTIVSPNPVSPSPLLSVTVAVLVTSIEGSAVIAKSTEFDESLNAVLIGNPTFFIKNSNYGLVNNSLKLNSDLPFSLNKTLRGSVLSDLPGTQLEIDTVYSILKSKGWNVNKYSGLEATETNLKEINKPNLLHIATHGFFFEDSKKLKKSRSLSTENKNILNDPLLRSGLVFSGAENTINGEILTKNNGWLNSYEASLLNLSGTELVVLSACETGSGEVRNGKGVYGLQRAILQAGAKTLIMSLWEVDDEATKELMTYFYEFWIDNHLSKRNAFIKAQKKIREKYKHPYYWGAFVLIGE